MTEQVVIFLIDHFFILVVDNNVIGKMSKFLLIAVFTDDKTFSRSDVMATEIVAIAIEHGFFFGREMETVNFRKNEIHIERIVKIEHVTS